MAKTSRGSFQFMLRLPDDLRDRIRLGAEKTGRSMTAEIVAALEEKFPAPLDDIGSMSVDDLLRRREVADPEERQRIDKYLGVFG